MSLESIREHGGLYPLATLTEMHVSVPAPGGNDWSHDAVSRSWVMIGAGVTHGVREPRGCANELDDAIWTASWVLSSYTDRGQMGSTDRDNNCWTTSWVA